MATIYHIQSVLFSCSISLSNIEEPITPTRETKNEKRLQKKQQQQENKVGKMNEKNKTSPKKIDCKQIL